MTSQAMVIRLTKISDAISININPPTTIGITPITRERAFPPMSKINIGDVLTKEYLTFHRAFSRLPIKFGGR